MFGALKRGRFRSMASLILVVNVVGELRPKRTLAASRGFLAAARLSCLRTNRYWRYMKSRRWSPPTEAINTWAVKSAVSANKWLYIANGYIDMVAMDRPVCPLALTAHLAVQLSCATLYSLLSALTMSHVKSITFRSLSSDFSQYSVHSQVMSIFLLEL